MPAHWNRVEELFHGASALANGPGRDAYLERECAGDGELLAEVRSLLESDEAAEGASLTGAIGQVAASLHGDEPQRPALQRIGPYRIERPLGEGGMGSVFLAVRDDDQYRKQVALKVIRRGLDAPWMVERFRHERQILASLEHPNIARMLDGGSTEEGLPYIVMEYVEGEPLTRYCESRKLSVGERLRLFRQVCDAVSYAHRKLVIHRDLKPANILATDAGGPRLLDFGTAKLASGEEGPALTVAPI